MKKIFNLILASAIAFSVASCDNERTNNEPANTGGKTAMQFRVSEASTRADNGQVDADGVGAESLVKDGLFMTVSANQTLTVALPPISFTPNTNGAENTGWVSKKIEYTGTTGIQMATLILNAPSVGAITQPDQTLAITDLAALTASTGFTMSGTTTKAENKINIIRGVKEDDVEDNKNLFPFTVERVVSKVQFSQEHDPVTLGGDLAKAGGSMKNLRYAVAGSADKIYLFADKAGTRTLDAEKVYTGFESAIHNAAKTTFSTDPSGSMKVEVARTNLTKVSDLNLVAPFSTPVDWTTKNSYPLSTPAMSYDSKSNESGIFFFENSLNAKITGKDQLFYNDITYVKIYATFAPKEVIKIEGSTTTKVGPTVGEHIYQVSVSDEWHDAHLGTQYEYSGASGNWMLTVKDEAGTFYKGANGKLYYDLKSARADGITSSMKYVGGKMVWMTPANNQLSEDGTYTKYADTRRNNIYSLSLTSIDGLGKNYDPIDPEDPNIKKPNDNPDEPIVDNVLPVDPEETYIQVKATILKWNLVHRGVVLK